MNRRSELSGRQPLKEGLTGAVGERGKSPRKRELADAAWYWGRSVR